MDENRTRQSILDYLRQHPRATARQIALALLRTPADIRYHLTRLHKAGLIFTIPAKNLQDHRGRPARSYTLTHQAAPEPLVHLLSGALTLLLICEPAHLEKSVDDLSRQIIPPDENPSARLVSRIARLMERLNNLQYHARWEARTGGPCIILQNCPYRNLLRQFPQLCDIDRRILQNHLKLPVEIEQHIQPDQPHPTDCRFTIQQG